MALAIAIGALRAARPDLIGEIAAVLLFGASLFAAMLLSGFEARARHRSGWD
jgi:hypothetical protein